MRQSFKAFWKASSRRDKSVTVGRSSTGVPDYQERAVVVRAGLPGKGSNGGEDTVANIFGFSGNGGACGFAQALFTEVLLARSIGVDDAVGVENQDIPGLQSNSALLKFDTGQQTEDRPSAAQA